MATGDKLVNLDELKLVYDKLHVPSVQVQIPTGQWSGSSTRTYTVNATGVTTDTIIDWAMDSSINYLTSELTVTPGSGTLTFSTPTLPAGTINVTLFFPGVNGEVVIQTLADVYSKSQVDTLLAAKVSTSNIINNLTNNDPTKVASQKEVYDLNAKTSFTINLPTGYTWLFCNAKFNGLGIVYITGRIDLTVATTEKIINLGQIIPSSYCPSANISFAAFNNSTDRIIDGRINTNGSIVFYRQETESLPAIFFTVVYTIW